MSTQSTPLYIFSDPICPWCYIGKTRLDKALEARPDHPFAIEWHPFQLNPNMPEAGIGRRSYLESKFGGKDAAVQAYLPIAEAAEADGLDLNFEAIKRVPNTINAHRLIHWAGLEQRQSMVVDRLFRAYFFYGLDIGEAEVLAGIAAEAEMDPEMVLRLLASDADHEDIKARDLDAREKGLRSVPTFVVAGQHVVPGAQPAELWLSVIDELAAQGTQGAQNGPEDAPA